MRTPTNCPTRSTRDSANRTGARSLRQSARSLRSRRHRHRGVFVSIDAGGALTIDRGYVRPDDELPIEPEACEGPEADGITSAEPEAPAVQRAIITIGGQPVEPDDEEDDVIKPLPERLIELTAQRTLALRDAVAQHPHVAMTMLLHKLVTDTFLHGGTTGCLHANVREIFFPSRPRI
jgi:ParB family chromosome partitioning protein